MKQPLFDSCFLGSLLLRNRFIRSATHEGLAEENGLYSPELTSLYADLARDGIGMIITGHTRVSPEGEASPRQASAASEEAVELWRIATDLVHRNGGTIALQLAHGGGKSRRLEGSIGPSPFPHPSKKGECGEATVSELDSVVTAFAAAADRARRGGFDAVQIHAAHGYLISEFLSPFYNRRTDEYGGSMENRYRFAIEIVDGIKRKCGKDFPVSLRYSVVSKTKGFRSGALPGEEYTEAGRDMAESEKAVKLLEDAGYDMLNCDNGTYDAWYWAHPPIYMPENCNLEDVEHIKKFVSIPVVAAGRLNPYTASDAIKEGKLDGAGFARQFLADQEWVTKLIEDRADDIRPCILCHNGCFNMAHYKGVPNDQDLMDSLHLSRCAVNAETMQWDKHFIKKTEKPKRVAIIGGGIGGMEAARVLTKRGHIPVIYEKGKELGGTFIAASAESYKGKLRDLLTWYRRQMEQLGIEVHLNTEIKDISSIDADEYIVATGAKARVLNVPGAEKLIEACDYLNGKPVGKSVAVIGGGLTGSEIAYELALEGKDVSIVEMKDDLISQKGVCLANSSYLREWFALHKTPVYLESSLKEVKDGSIIISMKDGSDKEIECESVISSVGYIPAPVAPKSGKVHIVGDADKVGNLRTVIWKAYEVAMKI